MTVSGMADYVYVLIITINEFFGELEQRTCTNFDFVGFHALFRGPHVDIRSRNSWLRVYKVLGGVRWW